MVDGLSSLKMKFGYAVETVAGSKPSSFTQLHRITSVGGVEITRENIAVTALEDDTAKYVEGIADTGGSVPITFNTSDDTITEWNTLIDAYEALSGGKQMWFTLWSPNIANAYFFKGAPPLVLSTSGASVNTALTTTVNLTLKEVVGYDTAVEPSPSVSE